MPEQALQEIRARFGGVPNVFARMHEVGDLAANWPRLRGLYDDSTPGSIPHVVVVALLAALALRCRQNYCFVLHSLAIVGAGVDKIEIEQLARLLAVPSSVPDRERWDRIVRLAWLAEGSGAHRHAAAHALKLECTADEHEEVLHVCTSGALLTSYVARFGLSVELEPTLAQLPAQLRELVPEFVSFHTAQRDDERDTQRPVSVTCSMCRKIRSTTDQRWYPHETAIALLPRDVLFSHGLCQPCVATLDLDS